ncbi:MAG: prolyl oligopeptidase family serine peptidase [Bryobacteraceae bacterium]
MRRIVFLIASSLYAQDAELVLRTSVGYNTMRASTPLTGAKKEEAATLAGQAQAAARDGKFGEAMRHYHHGIAVMQGFPWTPEIELASGLQAKVDDAIADPGQQLLLTLSSLYPANGAATAKVNIALRPATPGGTPVTLISSREIKSADLPLTLSIELPDSAGGNYDLIATLGEAENPALRNVLRKSVPIRVAELNEAAAKLKTRLKNQGLPIAEYALTLYENAEKGKANPHRTDFAKLFAQANTMLDAAIGGKDPFAGRTGDLKKAYRSPVDQTLQPYRLFIPSTYDGKKPAPLVIALHGMGGDESSMFDGYGATGALKKEAERLGFLMASPKGREPASMYRGAAEKDVLDVIAEVQRDYKVDAKRIYLMGHSMGGYGTWSIAMAYPEKFAALGPIAGGGNPQGMEKLKHIAQFVVHGDNDKTVPVTQSRMMVEAGKKAGAKIEYVEVPGGSHVDIAIPNFAPMFDFFARQVRD